MMRKNNTKKESVSKARKSSQKQIHIIKNDKKTNKTRCDGEWTETRYKGFIVSTLRAASLRWKPISAAKAASRVSRGRYKCANCCRIFGTKDVVVDHIIPVVPIDGWDSFDSFINRLFCERENLQLLCKECHTEKTNRENKLRKESKNDSI